jgi:hypothetical protein
MNYFVRKHLEKPGNFKGRTLFVHVYSEEKILEGKPKLYLVNISSSIRF